MKVRVEHDNMPVNIIRIQHVGGTLRYSYCLFHHRSEGINNECVIELDDLIELESLICALHHCKSDFSNILQGNVIAKSERKSSGKSN